MGMVFENYALLAHRTVLENVALPLKVRVKPEQSEKSVPAR